MKTKLPFHTQGLALCVAGALALAGTALAQSSSSSASDRSSSAPSDQNSGYSSGSTTRTRDTDSRTYQTRQTDSGMTMDRNRSSDDLPHADKKFIEKAARDNANEIALSQLAAERATNSDVKAFAERMVRDHQQLGQEVADLASRKGVAIDKEVRKGQEDDVKSLSNKSGEDFDKAYLKKMIKGHKDTLDLFEKAAKDCKDPDVIGLATKALPTISDHTAHVRQLGEQFHL